MDELNYSALDIAVFVSSMDLPCREESRLIERIWTGEKDLLSTRYNDNLRQFILDVLYWLNYFYEKPVLDREFPAVQKDLSRLEHSFQVGEYFSNFSDLDLFFKAMRIRILYCGEKYVRIKLRTLLASYGYKRRTPQLMEHIEHSMQFFHLEAALRGGVPCSIRDIELDDMLTFRVI